MPPCSASNSIRIIKLVRIQTMLGTSRISSVFVSLAAASADSDKQSESLIRRLNGLIEKTTILLPKVSDISKEELGDLVEKELQSTHETIDNAVRQLEVIGVRNTFHPSLSFEGDDGEIA